MTIESIIFPVCFWWQNFHFNSFRLESYICILLGICKKAFTSLMIYVCSQTPYIFVYPHYPTKAWMKLLQFYKSSLYIIKTCFVIWLKFQLNICSYGSNSHLITNKPLACYVLVQQHMYVKVTRSQCVETIWPIFYLYICELMSSICIYLMIS